MSGRQRPCVSRIWCAVQIFIHIMDLITDCSTLVVYWELQSKTTFTMSLISVVLSLPIGIAGYVYQFRLCKGGSKAEDAILTLKLLGILVESIPQLTINLYLLSECHKTVSIIQYVSGGFSFLAICIGIVHYDISVKLHKGIGMLQKLFIFAYRTSYLASRILALVYFTYTLAWWTAAVIVAHWGVGLITLMKNRVETLARSLAFVFLNTFVYVGEFAGIKTLFILLFYVLENLMMVAIAQIVAAQVGTGDTAFATTQSSESAQPESATGIIILNEFELQPAGMINCTASSGKGPTSFYVNEFCLHSNVVPVHVALNVIAVMACCLYNVSFHYNSCADKNDSEESVRIEKEEKLEIQSPEELSERSGLAEEHDWRLREG